MGRDDSWPAKVPSVVVLSFSFSEAVHTTMHTMYTTKQAVPVECLDWWLFPLIHSLGRLSHLCLNGRCANQETPKMAERYFQRQSTDGSQLATEIGFNPNRTTPLCYNMNCRQPPLG